MRTEIWRGWNVSWCTFRKICKMVIWIKQFHLGFLEKINSDKNFVKLIDFLSYYSKSFSRKIVFVCTYSVWQLNVQILVLIVLPNSRFTFLWTGWMDFQNSNAGWSVWPCSMLNNFYKSIHQRRAKQKYSESGLNSHWKNIT